MDDSDFDRLARALSAIRSRRGFLAVAGGFAALLAPRIAGAAQLGPSSCGSAGDVCTMMMGCCDGLTCATSAINTNYGVCVTGEGERTVVGTTLISPFADGVEEQVTVLANQVATAASDTTGTDRQAELEARKDEKKARRETRQDEIKARRDAQQSKRELRRDDRQTESVVAQGPRLRLEYSPPGTRQELDSTAEVPSVVTVPVGELVRVTNLSQERVTLHRIEPIGRPGVSGADSFDVDLDPGDWFFFESGVTPDPFDNVFDGDYTWTPETICNGGVGAGFIVFASFPSSDEIHRFTILCDTPVVSFTPPPEPQRRHKRKSKGGKGGGNGNGGAKSRSKPKSRAKGRNR
jgi:hypothetical protein